MGPACGPVLYYLKPVTLLLDSCVPYCPTVLHSGADQGNIHKLTKLVRGPPKIATEKCQALVGFRCGLRDMRLPLRWVGPMIIWKSDTKVLGLRNTCDDFATQCVKASWKNTFTWQMHYVTFWDIEFKAPGFTPPVERFKIFLQGHMVWKRFDRTIDQTVVSKKPTGHGRVKDRW